MFVLFALVCFSVILLAFISATQFADNSNNATFFLVEMTLYPLAVIAPLMGLLALHANVVAGL